MFASTLILLLSLLLLQFIVQLAVSVTPSTTQTTSTPSLTTRRLVKRKRTSRENERMSIIDQVLGSRGISSDIAETVGEYEGLYTTLLASQVFNSPMTLHSEVYWYGIRHRYTSTTNVAQHSSIELGTLSELTNGLQGNKALNLEFKVSLPNISTRHCHWSDSERSMLGIEIRNEKTMLTDRCMNVVRITKETMTIQVSLLPSIATLDWKYYFVLPSLSKCRPDTPYIVSATYCYTDLSNKVNRTALPKRIYFGQLPQQFERPERVQVLTLPRIPYKEQDLDQLTDARRNVPGLSRRSPFGLQVEGIFATRTYTRGSMIHLGSMREITSQKRKRNSMDVTVRVQVFDMRETKDDKEIEVKALSDVRVLAYEDVKNENEKRMRLPNEDWAIQSLNSMALKDSPHTQGKDQNELTIPHGPTTHESSEGIVLTKSLARHTLNADYWLRLPPLPHGFEYRVTNSMRYVSYLRNGIQSTHWIGKDEERL